MARRSSSSAPPQIPKASPVSSAQARHAARIGHSAQIALACAARRCRSVARSASGPKNSSGSAVRQAAPVKSGRDARRTIRAPAARRDRARVAGEQGLRHRGKFLHGAVPAGFGRQRSRLSANDQLRRQHDQFRLCGRAGRHHPALRGGRAAKNNDAAHQRTDERADGRRRRLPSGLSADACDAPLVPEFGHAV